MDPFAGYMITLSTVALLGLIAVAVAITRR